MAFHLFPDKRIKLSTAAKLNTLSNLISPTLLFLMILRPKRHDLKNSYDEDTNSNTLGSNIIDYFVYKLIGYSKIIEEYNSRNSFFK